MIPRRFGRYQVIEEVARGGMGTVLHARDPRFKRDVALKLLPRPFVDEAQFRARFQREAQTIAALEHEAIVPVYDSGEQHGQAYLVGAVGLVGGSGFAARGPGHATAATTVSPTPEIGVEFAEPGPKPSLTGTSPSTPTRTTATLPPAPVPFTIQTDANCRLAPGVNYDVAGYLTPGQATLAHGRDPDGTWWWIERPGGDRSCWVSGLLVGLSGGGEALPVLTAGPASTRGLTATPVPPRRTTRNRRGPRLYPCADEGQYAPA